MTASASDADAAWWQAPLAGLVDELGSRPTGLTSAEARRNLKRHGRNELREATERPLLIQFLRRFRNPLVLILVAASGVSALTGDVASFAIIASMVLLSVVLDFVQEYRAGQSARRLRQSVQLRARVLRDGIARAVPTAQVVPGDVVMLAAGSLVPADGRLLAARDLFVNQALLTGESYPVEKRPGAPPAPPAEITAAVDALFMGTSVVSGSAELVVCRTGKATALGEIAHTLSLDPPPTAFEIGTRRFGMLIMRLTVLMVLFVLMVNTLTHKPLLESFLFAIALAVGLTPELLPMVMSVTLSRGALEMAKKHVIVKRLASIQNLGSMDVLCTDKTGTLTEGSIVLERHVDARGRDSPQVLTLAYVNSAFETGLKSPLDDAILAHEHLDVRRWRKVDEVPFDFERRRVSVLVDDGETRDAGRQGRTRRLAGAVDALPGRPRRAASSPWTGARATMLAGSSSFSAPRGCALSGSRTGWSAAIASTPESATKPGSCSRDSRPSSTRRRPGPRRRSRRWSATASRSRS